MPEGDTFELTFRRLRREFSAKTKRTFLTDMQGQIEEDTDIQRILSKSRPEPRYIAVTFDRWKNDNNFSYSYFDMLLVALDALSGGAGIYKPSNQMRALRWNGSRRDLMQVLRYFARNNAQVRYRRALILPFPLPPVGQRIDPNIHMR